MSAYLNNSYKLLFYIYCIESSANEYIRNKIKKKETKVGIIKCMGHVEKESFALTEQKKRKLESEMNKWNKKKKRKKIRQNNIMKPTGTTVQRSEIYFFSLYYLNHIVWPRTSNERTSFVKRFWSRFRCIVFFLVFFSSYF